MPICEEKPEVEVKGDPPLGGADEKTSKRRLPRKRPLQMGGVSLVNFSLRRRASFYCKNFLEELLHYPRSGSENSDQVVPSKRFSVSSMVGRAFHQTT